MAIRVSFPLVIPPCNIIIPVMINRLQNMTEILNTNSVTIKKSTNTFIWSPTYTKHIVQCVGLFTAKFIRLS